MQRRGAGWALSYHLAGGAPGGLPAKSGTLTGPAGAGGAMPAHRHGSGAAGSRRRRRLRGGGRVPVAAWAARSRRQHTAESTAASRRTTGDGRRRSAMRRKVSRRSAGRSSSSCRPHALSARPPPPHARAPTAVLCTHLPAGAEVAGDEERAVPRRVGHGRVVVLRRDGPANVRHLPPPPHRPV
jgi:hypothetical protein